MLDDETDLPNQLVVERALWIILSRDPHGMTAAQTYQALAQHFGLSLDQTHRRLAAGSGEIAWRSRVRAAYAVLLHRGVALGSRTWRTTKVPGEEVDLSALRYPRSD